MSKEQPLLTSRAVEVFAAMLWRRRLFRPADEWFRAIDYWDWMYGADTIRAYKSSDPDIGRPGVVSFDGRVCLTADERRIGMARKGCPFSNTLIGHEISHVALGHHNHSAHIANFSLAEGRFGRVIRPKSLKEKEADFGSIAFLCGMGLFDERLETLDLARRACADAALVGRVRRMVLLETFRRELSTPRPDAAFGSL